MDSALAAQNGEWRALWDDYGGRLLLFARQQAPETGAAEDLVQEAFVRFWKARQKEPGLHPSLLFTFVRRLAVDEARRSERRRVREERAAQEADSGPWFEGPLEAEERRLTVEAALRRLPQTQREVLVLKLWAGLTFDQIGRTLEISPNTAASRYRYALGQLREVLTPVLP